MSCLSERLHFPFSFSPSFLFLPYPSFLFFSQGFEWTCESRDRECYLRLANSDALGGTVIARNFHYGLRIRVFHWNVKIELLACKRGAVFQRLSRITTYRISIESFLRNRGKLLNLDFKYCMENDGRSRASFPAHEHWWTGVKSGTVQKEELHLVEKERPIPV